MDRLQAMRVFVEVARGGSFAAAARTLHMSPPAVTRTIAALEAVIGAELFVRTTRSVKLTEAGQRYEPECERILADVAAAEAMAAGARAQPVGTLTVTASVMFGQLHLAPIITAFCDAYPDVDVQLVLLDRVTNLVEEGIDVALRIGPLPDSALRAVAIGSVRRVIAGAPDYLRREGVPQVPADLRGHRIVAVTSAYASVDWRFGDEVKQVVRVHPRIRCNNIPTAIAIARAGWALTRVLSYQLSEDLTAGRLRLVLEAHEEPPLPVHIVHGGTRAPAAKVRAFVDFAADRLRADPIFRAAR